MIRELAAAAFALAMLPAGAAEAKTSGRLDCLGSVLGWAKDGSAFAWTDCETGGMVLDARTGRVFVLDQAKLEAWKSAHSPLKADASRTSPNGQATADVKLLHQGEGGAWKGDVWTPAAPASAELVVTAGRKTRVSAAWVSGIEALDAYWSPDGKRIAWVVMTEVMAGGAVVSWEVTVGPGGGPRIQVLAPKSILKEAVPAVAAAIEVSGYAPIFTGPAQKARDTSVVYAAPGFEVDASQIAAKVPGGASVEKLTWNAGADLVVAVGKSALPPKEAKR